MAALVGFIMIALIVILLLKGKMSPIVVLAVIPTAAALLLGFGPRKWPDLSRTGSAPPQATEFYLSFL